MIKNKILAATDGTMPLIGTFFHTEKLANAYIRQQRRQFITGLCIVRIKGGFMVISEKQMDGWDDMIIK